MTGIFPFTENEDHHCIWLNNCIGRRNYRSFFTFIVTATLLCFYVLGFSVAHLWLYSKENNKNLLQAIEGVPISFVLALVAFFLMWSVGGLTLYHTYLISKNLTTHEQVSDRDDARLPRSQPALSDVLHDVIVTASGASSTKERC